MDIGVSQKTPHIKIIFLCSVALFFSFGSEQISASSIHANEPTQETYRACNHGSNCNLCNQCAPVAPGCDQNGICSKLNYIKNEQDLILTKVCRIETQIDSLSTSPCDAIAITSPTTISTPGSYCLANALTGAGPLISIASNNVVLDLNGQFLLVTTGNAIELNPVNGVGLINVTIKNGFLASDQSSTSNGIVINPTTQSLHFNIMLVSLNIRLCNGTGIVGSSTQGFTVQDCDVDSNGLNLSVNSCGDLALINSIFRLSSTGNGATIANCERTVIQNSKFNRNNLAGLVIDGCLEVNVQNCIFNDNNNDGFDGVISDPTFLQLASIIIEDCTCANNFGKGLFINPGTNEAQEFKLSNCKALFNADHGFTFSGVATDIVLEECVATGNCPNATGFVVTTTGGSTTTLIGCVAEGNVTGFDFSQSFGSGVIQGCKAVGNSNVNQFVCSTDGCGFNDRVGSLYQYVSNVSQGNGINPAATQAGTAQDTNYCLSGNLTQYTPTAGGPSLNLPFKQFGRATLNGQFNPGITSWDNVTL